MLADDVLFQPITDLSQQIRTRRLSPVELTESYLARIEKLNGKYNAFQTVTADFARAQAQASEKRANAGKLLSPLDGIPWAAKDLLATKGIPTSWGARPLTQQTFDRDATVVQRLHDAGAVMLGKAAMVEFAGGLGYRFANASVSGPGRNPWDPSRWTGGSSSGSGAAVSGGLAAFAIGTETWGSILCPSAFCGLTGLRPTYGVVPRTGAMVCADTFDKIGPIARSAADCRLVLQTIAGHDEMDATSATERLNLAPRAGRPLRQLRAALVPLDWSKTGEPEVKAAFDAAVEDLRRAGLQVDEAKLPDYPASEVAGTLITVEAVSAFAPFFDDGRVKQLIDPWAQHQREIASPITGADAMKAWRMRAELQQQMAEFFERWDVIVTPNFKSVAPPVEQDLYEALPYPDPVGAIGNACGLPAIALPCGFGKARMPAGFQIVAAPFEEATLLDLGDAYQARTTHHRERAR